MSRPSMTTLARCAHVALLGHHGAADAGNHGHLGCAVGDFGSADGLGDILAVEADAAGRKLDVGGDGELLGAVHVVPGDVLPQGPEGDGAIHGAGIDVDESEARGESFGDGALAGAGRAVDGDHHASWFGFCQAIE